MGGVYEWPDLDAMLAYLLPALEKLGLKAIDLSCANSDYYQTSGKIIRQIRPLWHGVLMGGASLSVEQAEAELEAGLVDAVTWGRAFIANPDLAAKMQAGAELVPFDDSMRDTLIDLHNYSTMAIMLIDEKSGECNKDARFTQFSSVNFDSLDLFIQKQTEYFDDFLTQGSIEIISRSANQIQEVLDVTTNGITFDKNKHKMLRDILLNLCNYAAIAVMLYDDTNANAHANAVADETTDEEEECECQER